MPRQNREAPGCYVPSGGLSHCEIVPISDTYCCPKSCRLGAGRLPPPPPRLARPPRGRLTQGWIRALRAESGARLNFGEHGANLRIKVVERGHFLDVGFVAQLPLA